MVEAEGWLVVFDQRQGRSWEERIYRAEEVLPGGRRIHVIGA